MTDITADARARRHGRRPLSPEWRRHWIRYPAEGALLYLCYGLCKLLPLDWSSALLGKALRRIGPLLGAHRKALRNIERAMPELPPERRRAIACGMWENLGRVLGEYPHLHEILDNPRRMVLVEGRHVFAQRHKGRPLIFVSGHFANWELAAPTAEWHDFHVSIIYRAPNNRFADRLIRHIRGSCGLGQLPKGAQGAKGAIRLVAEGGNLAVLVDQRMSDGIEVPFFGRPAMTAPAVAQFALRYDAIILPVRLVRRKGARFEVVCEPPLELERTGDRQADVAAIMTRINAILERWIRERPEQWLWLHRRWRD